MKRTLLLSAVVLTILTGSAPADSIVSVTNDGFELPDLGSGGSAYGYGPDYGGGDAAGTIPESYPALPSDPPGWIFAGTSGLAANGSDLGLTGATNGNSDGTMSTSGQAAFVQSTNGLTAGIIGFLPALSNGEYTISFDEEGSASGSNEIEVSYGNQILYIGTPNSTSSFNSVTTSPVTISGLNIGSQSGGAGAGKVSVIEFKALSSNDGDFTTFIDNVSVTAVPEPSQWAWLAFAGTIGFVALRRFRRQTAI